MRIVSLLPAATEMVCRMGLGGSLVAVSHECDFPAGVARLPRVTRSRIPGDLDSGAIDSLVREHAAARRSLYEFDPAGIIAGLAPDLIITQTLCDVCAVSDRDLEGIAVRLAKPPRIVHLRPHRFDDLFVGMEAIAEAAGDAGAASRAISELRNRAQDVSLRSAAHQALTGVTPPHATRVMILEWLDPPYTAGHWNPELVALAGGREVLGVAGERSRQVDWGAICQADPEVLVIAACGWDVTRAGRELPLPQRIIECYPALRELACVRRDQVFVVDANAYFSRPGPRLVDSLEWLAHLIHSDIHPRPGDHGDEGPAASDVAAIRAGHDGAAHAGHATSSPPQRVRLIAD